MRSALFIALTCGQALMAVQNPVCESKNMDFSNQPYYSYSEYTSSKKNNSSSWYKACAVTGVVLGIFAVESFYGGYEFGPGRITPKTFLIAGAAGTATYFIYDIANK